MIRLISLAFSLFLATVATAQERPRTILVLDGSGSMWGQIDGINKIVIAREVIGEILQSFPPDQELGLTVYGHRRKGDCTDIETVIAPGSGLTGAITDAVNAINPRGKTPLSAAVIAAAEALRYTEERATVILVSDGIETCDIDPCAVGRQLEEAGVDFTAHVIGFDVEEDPAARAQLQCLAEETGGIFKTASNATELSDALATVAEPVAPPPLPYDVTFVATDGVGGPQITDGLQWTVSNGLGIPVLTGGTSASPVLSLIPGTYTANVLRTEDGAVGTASVTIQAQDARITIALPLLERAQTITFAARVNGASVNRGLEWTVTDDTGAVVLRDTSDASPSAELMPGAYTAAVLRPADGASAERAFTVANTAQTVVLNLPDLPPEPVRVQAFAIDGKNGPRIRDPLIWDLTGPDGVILSSEQAPNLDLQLTKGTYTLSVMRPADEAYVEQRFGVGTVGKSLTLELPEYRPLATLIAPDTAPMGATIQVEWTGPAEESDYISVARLDDPENRWINYTYTREGPLLDLLLPPDAVTYEIRYMLGDPVTRLARHVIKRTTRTRSLPSLLACADG